MYDFQPLDSYDENEYVSSVAISLNGRKLDTLIPHYRTISVTGRELIGYRISSLDDIPGRDGSLVLEKTLPPRIITVRFLISCPDSSEFRRAFNALNEELYRAHIGGDSEITFDDEPDYYFIGTPGSVDEPPTNVNETIGQFSIYCWSPYKTKLEPLEFTSSGTSLTIGNPSDGSIYPLKLDSISMTTVETDKVVVSNGKTGRKIILNREFLDGQTLKITPDGITLNGANITDSLDFVESDWHDFTIHLGDTINTTPTMSRTVKVRERLL